MILTYHLKILKSPCSFFSFFSFLSLLITFLTNISQSQTTVFSPEAVVSPGFARTVNKLYISGGASVHGDTYYASRQTMSLDLAIPWNSISPAWTKLADCPIQFENTAIFSSDEQTLYAFHILDTNSPWQYSVQNNSWQEWTAIKFENAGYLGITAVTDPRTGLIYLVGGYEEVNFGAPYMKMMDIVDPASQAFHTVNLPDPTKFLFYRSFYGAVWSKNRSSILYWGGMNNVEYAFEPVRDGLTELVTDSMRWSTLQTQGFGPRRKVNHCMTANEEGTMLAIYGGSPVGSDIVDGELWILNLTTSTWSQGPSGPTRESAVCTIAGDYFLIWGGMTDINMQAPSEMVIFDFNTSSYVKRYTPPAYYKDLKPPPPLTRTKAPWDTDGSANLAIGDKHSGLTSASIRAIIGGVVGGLLLMGAIVGIMFFMRRQRISGQSQNARELKATDAPGGMKGLLGQRRGGGRRKKLNKDPKIVALNPKEEDDDEERTFMALEEEQRILDQRRQALVLQHQVILPRLPMAHKRAPSALMNDKAEVITSPVPPPQPSPDAAHSVTYSPENLHGRGTVQGMTSPIDMRHADSYIDEGLRNESELVQDTIEPIYKTSPTINYAIPDLNYIPPPNVGMHWTKQQQQNNPHTVIDSYSSL